MPTKSNLKGRTSTINNAFVISITPFIKPDPSILKQYYKELEIEEKQCGYCMRMGLGKSVDHIFPLVIDGMPSGYITDITNLIPCCTECNSTKGGKLFEDWYKEQKNVDRLNSYGMSYDDINKRYNIIMNYINNHCSQPLSYKEIVGEKLWNEYINRKNKMLELLQEDQLFCDNLNEIITKYVMEKLSK